MSWTVPPTLVIDLPGSSATRLLWLRTWLKQYLALKGSLADDDPDLSFFYLVLGTDLEDASATGEVDGTVVLEAGYGGEPVGPPNADTTTLRHMVQWVLARLTAG